MEISETRIGADASVAHGLDHITSFAPPYDSLLGNIDSVISEWRLLARQEPWSNIPASRLVDSLPEILPRILRLAAQGTTRIDEDLSEMIAEQHGYFRRADKLPLSAVADEWNFVKRACWKVLVRCQVDPVAASQAMHRLDILCDDAIGFSLRGYYAPELDMLRGKGLERRDGRAERRMNAPTRRQM